MKETPYIPSISKFRNYVLTVLEGETRSNRKRHIVILGIDGIPYDLALKSWRCAQTQKMKSVFPSTSSTAWLSSLSGMRVEEHGVPGVIFRFEDRNEKLINIFTYKGHIHNLCKGNIFSDAATFGYMPLSIIGDLEDLNCTWRDLLLQHSVRVEGYKFYTDKKGDDYLSSRSLYHRLRSAIRKTLQVYKYNIPCLLWFFIDADLYIHRYGYDSHIIHFLGQVEKLALELIQDNIIVITHSDHGLIATHNDPDIEKIIKDLSVSYEFSMGGAGRTRWVYPKSGTEQLLFDKFLNYLPSSILIRHADEFFDQSLVKRVGKIILIAQAEEFLVPNGYCFDHGSLTDMEMYVPVTTWMQ
jgi:hypothetical protein